MQASALRAEAAASVLPPSSTAGAGAEETRKEGGREEGRRGGEGGGQRSAGAMVWKSREPSSLKVGSPARAPLLPRPAGGNNRSLHFTPHAFQSEAT